MQVTKNKLNLQIAKHLKLKKKMCSCMTKNYTGKLTSFTTYAMHVKKECINQRDLSWPTGL